MRGIYILIFLLVLVFGRSLVAQHFPSKQYMISDGMPSNSIYDIAQHKDGMMWFMSKAGPTYYDTREWHIFSDSLNLPTSTNSKIRTYHEKIWVAGLNDTQFTVQFYHDGQWIEIVAPELATEIMGLFYFDVYENGDDYLVLLGFKGELYSYAQGDEAWKVVAIPDELTLNNIQMIDETFYLSTSDGLYTFSELDAFDKVPLPYEKLPSTFFLNVAYQNDVYYVLGYNWFAEMNTNEINYLIPDAVLNVSAMTSKTSIVVNDQVIIFGANTPARLVNRTERSFQDLLIDGKKVNIGSTRIFADKEGTIWVSDTRGLFKFNLLQFQNYNSNSGLVDDEVSVVRELSDGSIVLANPERLNVLIEDRIDNYPSQRKNEQNFRILDILEDTESNRLLMATNDGGLISYRTGQYDQPQSVITNSGRITALEMFRSKIYVAGNQGFFELKNQQLQSLKPDVRTIRNMSVLGSYLGLYTTGYGLYLYDGSTFRHCTSPVFGLRNVYDGVTHKGEIVLATRDGLATLSENQIVPWDGLHINSPVYALIEDAHQHLWIGSDHGVYHYDGSQLELFDIDEGLLGNEANRNGLIEDAKGQVWIGTEKGASLFKGDHSEKLNIPLKVKITDVQADGNRSIMDMDARELGYDKNSLIISFQCLSYIDEQKINFRYRIKSSEEQWVQLSNAEGTITLNNLEPGNYQFEIQARYGKDDWGEATIFEFEIQNPYYYSWWFILVLMLLLVAIARIGFYFRYLILIKKQRSLEALITERTQEIRELNDQLEEKVRNRTMELEGINLKLAEYAFINAHHLRAPLTKIMSAIHVVEETEGGALNKEMLKVLADSAKELDQVIYSINDILKDDKSGSD